jgi:cytochrome c556
MQEVLNMGRYKLAGGILLSALASAIVLAATPQEMQKKRHDHYHELGDAVKAVRDGIKADAPDWAAIEKAADVINKASINQSQWFPKGTGPEAGKTRALPEIWSKPDDFAAAMKMLEERAPNVLAAAKTKDADAVNKSLRELGGACKNCHDTFRSPEEHQ